MEFFQNKRNKIFVLFIVLLLGVILLIAGKNEGNDANVADGGVTLATQYKAELERTAASMCTSFVGIDGAQVNITFDGTMSCVYAKNSEGSYGGTYFSSGGEPLFLKYDYPDIVGCVVICTGTERSDVKLELTQMLSSYLGISTNKIYIGYGS